MRKSSIVLGVALALGALLLVGVATGVLFAPMPAGDGEVGAVERDEKTRERPAEPRPGIPSPRLEGHPDAVRPEDRPKPPRGEVVVRVVDEDGVPIAAAWVSVYVGDEAPFVVASDARGEVVLTDLPADRPAWVAIGRRRHEPDALVPLDGERVSIRAPRIVTLSVRLYDAESGVEVGHAGWRLHGKGAAAALRFGSGDETDLISQPDRFVAQPYAVEPGLGYVDWAGDAPTMISRYATRLEARHPLRREARVAVVPVDGDGEDLRDAQVNAFGIGLGVRTSPETENWMLGGIPLKGVPFFAGETLRVQVGAPGRRGGVGEVVLPAHAHDEVDVEVVLEKLANRKDDPLLHFETDNDLPFEESLGALDVPSDVPEMVLGALEVRVLRFDGRPAVGAQVDVPVPGTRRTDQDGRLYLERVVAGDHVVRLTEPGLLPVAESVRVTAGGTTTVTLREVEGATLVLTVKDPSGRPLPFAHLQYSSHREWCDLDPATGVQRIDPYTDEAGRRTLRRVNPGKGSLQAWWGRKHGTLEFEVEDREVKELTLVVK